MSWNRSHARKDTGKSGISVIASKVYLPDIVEPCNFAQIFFAYVAIWDSIYEAGCRIRDARVESLDASRSAIETLKFRPELKSASKSAKLRPREAMGARTTAQLDRGASTMRVVLHRPRERRARHITHVTTSRPRPLVHHSLFSVCFCSFVLLLYFCAE